MDWVIGFKFPLFLTCISIQRYNPAIAESYEEELDLSIQRLTSLIEPIIIILLAVVVGFIIAAVLLPLLDFSSMG